MKFQGQEVGLPWRRPERRNADITALALAQLQARASFAGSRETVAREMAAGLISRALAGATVEGPGYVRAAVTPGVLGQIGRDLVTAGASMHVIEVDQDAVVRLFPASSWTFSGDYDPETWIIEADLAGPSRTETKRIHYSGVVHCRWGQSPGSPHSGRGPLEFASLTAKLHGEAERSLGDEASGPIANLISTPQGASGEDADGDPEKDPLTGLTNDIRTARGRSVLVETTTAGWGDGKLGAPKQDWKPTRLGPSPPAAWVEARRDAEAAILSACGCFSALFQPNADGTAQREALRRLHLQTLSPLAKLIQAELSAKLEAPVTLGFDLYGFDLSGRALAFGKLVSGGMAVDAALSLTGLLGAAQAEPS